MGHAQNPPTAPTPKSEADVEPQDRGVWPEDFGASTSTSRMRDLARRRREAEEKLAQHLFATEPQLRPGEPPAAAVSASPLPPGPVTPVQASEQHIHEHHIHGQHIHESHGPAAAPEATSPAGPANTPE